MTDEEWALVEPLIAPAKRGGNKRTVDVRQVVNGLIVNRLPRLSHINEDVFQSYRTCSLLGERSFEVRERQCVLRHRAPIAR